MPRSLGIEFISVFGLPPVDFVHLAADLGCQSISTALQPMPNNPTSYSTWSLLEDRQLRTAMQTAMQERGIRISLGEGFLIRPGIDIRDGKPALEVMRELGAARVNVVSIEPDLPRTFDQCAAFAELAADVGCESTLEFLPLTAIATLPSALDVLRHVGRDDCKLVIDAMHLFRSGGTLADLAAVDPRHIGYAQLCDVPLEAPLSNHGNEARYERLPPGAGELPLLGLLKALPRDIEIGLEVPMRTKAAAGIGPQERLRPCVAVTRELFARAAAS